MSESVFPEPPPRRPGRPRKNKEQGPDVRDRLLASATELAVEQGFESCGLREIAARANVSSGMISYYFNDRQGLYEAMVQRAFDRIAHQISDLAAKTTADEGDRLSELVRIQVEMLSADPWLPKLILREMLANQDPAARERLGGRIARGPLTVMTEWLRSEQERGVLRPDFDPGLMAITVSSLTAFPFLAVSLVGKEMGEEMGFVDDETFAERLVAHNQKILAHGLRAPAKETHT